MIKEALLYAYEKHQGDLRKNTKIPYIVHPLDVASILLKERNNSNISDELIVAGLLHDVFEDTDTSLDEIEEKFGNKVMILVKAASEPEKHKVESKEEKKQSWKARKTHTIESIKKETKEAKLLSCADKLSNLRDMINDIFIDDKNFWKRFNASKEEIKWYYQSMLKSYSSEISIEDSTTFKLFENAVISLFEKEPNLKTFYCEKCNKEYTEDEIDWIPNSQDGFLEDWIAICPKKHETTVHKEDA
jgi:(p)ppGpp synthase/HD superfamily hydrolase